MQKQPPLLNAANTLTLLRLVLSVAFFSILVYNASHLRLPVDGDGEVSWKNFRGEVREAHAGLRAEERGLALLFDVAFGIFVLAAVTDLLDGRIARRYNLVTDFGRMADPIVDKIMILGAFTLLMPLTFDIAGWMVVLVLAREFLVSGIRGFAEARGVPFPATFWGKWKMESQTACVGAGILHVGHPDSAVLRAVFLVLLWPTLAMTVISGAVYVARARRLLRGQLPSPREGAGEPGEGAPAARRP